MCRTSISYLIQIRENILLRKRINKIDISLSDEKKSKFICFDVKKRKPDLIGLIFL